MVTGVKKIPALLACCMAFLFSSYVKHPPATRTVKITFRFINTVKTSPLILDSATYTNPFGEQYQVAKLKYYISNVQLNTVSGTCKEPNSYHLLDAAEPASLYFTFDAKPGSYQSISFLAGVDSIKNVSGAQSGALDPANGMFWTWNSGYVMFKLEGNSPSSTIINHRLEYHIGGFSGPDNVLQQITLALPSALQLIEGDAITLNIIADLDKVWQGAHDLKIAITPATMAPGILSKKIADNYNRMFSIKDVQLH